ncbi:hypothetical protein P152DRAFT_450688 [Eremomyces bilateralis CBS 781.70]|uniref:Uncharacterized protein n=1 Tax=Eremomyces bilateralis CBS 781.70 TaxID=1392243 RepID=A0A6G1FZG6_9PEZI|nr:uncharacterized protein P152DRAFT_450688 [Eremomyces bilateralis CBS 781.70]KAF1811112.1 hypothetical protein P152DRAFT_450688 [Eremomyces bilateralis CBS 781.70]
MATTRLRKAFRYPEGDDTDPPEGMDEVEQETLIDKLAAEDTARSILYTRLFLILPLLPLPLYYLPTPFTPLHHHPRTSLLPYLQLLLATLSLLSSAYILYFLPATSPTPPKHPARAAAVHAFATGPHSSGPLHPSTALGNALDDLDLPAWLVSLLRASGFDIFFETAPISTSTSASRNSLARIVPFVGGIAAVMLYVTWVATGGTDGGSMTEEFWSAGLPAVVFCLALFVRGQLRPVDVEGLRRLRYPYKGA